MRRREPLLVDRRARQQQAESAVERPGVTGRHRARRRRLGDQRPTRRREPVREQPAQRHVDVVLVAEERAAVGERVPGRLEEEVQLPLACLRRERVALEDVQRLADGRAAARGRAHPVDVESAVRHPRRRPLRCLIRVQVAHRHQPGSPDVVRGRGHRRPLHGLDDRVRDRTAVEALGAEVRDPRVRVREVGVAEDRADVLRRPVGVEEERGRRRDVVEEVHVSLRLREEGRVDHEPVARDPDRGRERLRERDRAVAVERVGPAGDRARHADGEPAVAGGSERQWRPVLPERVDPHVRPVPSRGGRSR